MTKGNLAKLLDGFFGWKKKAEERAKSSTEEELYAGLKRQIDELTERRTDWEMTEVLNSIGMIYHKGGYGVSFRDCYEKLEKDEAKTTADK